MANPPCGRGRQIQGTPAQAGSAPAGTSDPPGTAGESGPAAMSEPPVRRWSHPVEGIGPAQYADQSRQISPSLNYIQHALSYQNQMLADIKALLEQIILDLDDRKPEK